MVSVISSNSLSMLVASRAEVYLKGAPSDLAE